MEEEEENRIKKITHALFHTSSPIDMLILFLYLLKTSHDYK